MHPKTPWGEPDIQATLNMMQAANVPLERCANGYRFGGPPCDLNKEWLTEDGIQPARRGRAPAASTRAAADREGRIRPRAAVGRHRPGHAAAADQPHRRSAERAAARRSRPKASGARSQMGSSWSLPGEDPVYEDAARLRLLGQLPLARHALVDDAVSLQRRLPDHAGARRGRVRPRDDSRRARHLHRRPAAAVGSRTRQYMGESRGHWEGNTLVVETTNYKEGPPLINLAVVGSPAGNRFPVSDKMKTTERITRLNNDMWLYEIKTEDPVDPHASVHGALPDAQRPDLRVVGIRVPRGQHDHSELQRRRTATSVSIRRPEPPAQAAQVAADVANALAGRWTGQPTPRDDRLQHLPGVHEERRTERCRGS